VKPKATLGVGYVEGDYVLVAPIETAEIASVAVRRGERVEKGAPLAALTRTDAEIAVAQASAAVGQASAQLADLKVGKRPEEIAVLAAALASAQANGSEAKRTADRTADLLKRGIATQADYDRARTALEMAQAQIGQAEANLAVGRFACAARSHQGGRKRVAAGASRARTGQLAAWPAQFVRHVCRPRRRRAA
jgi:HlyD family secretion protein